MFARLPLDSSEWGGSNEEIIRSLQDKIRFLETLLSDVQEQGVQYLKHARRVRDEIAYWKRHVEQEEIDAIRRKCYR